MPSNTDLAKEGIPNDWWHVWSGRTGYAIRQTIWTKSNHPIRPFNTKIAVEDVIYQRELIGGILSGFVGVADSEQEEVLVERELLVDADDHDRYGRCVRCTLEAGCIHLIVRQALHRRYYLGARKDCCYSATAKDVPGR